MPNVAHCKSCGAEIFFIKTVKGKSAPVDAASMYFVPHPEGTSFVLVDGTVEKGLASSADEPGAKIGYISHFATCPNANQHRHPRKSERKKA